MKVASTVDYMVAAGDLSGVVSIFVIPKMKPIFLPADHDKAKRGVYTTAFLTIVKTGGNTPCII